jgi:hypothetical protein
MAPNKVSNFRFFVKCTIMKLLITFLFSAFLFGCKEKTTHKLNLNFEKLSDDDEFFEGWSRWGDSAFEIEKMSRSGKYSGSIALDDDLDANRSFGIMEYVIPDIYLGKEIRLEGYMKTENIEYGYAAFQLKTGYGSPYSVKSKQSIMAYGSTDWEKYTINLPYPEDVKTIYITCILIGKGKAWFDDIVLKVDGKDIQKLKKE